MHSTAAGSKGVGKRPATEATSDHGQGSSSSEPESSSEVKKLRLSSGLARLSFNADAGRIPIETVRSSNRKAHRLRGLVTVFVGGTDGIGKMTAIQVFRHTTSPKAYIIGRNSEKGNRLVNELKSINSTGDAFFIGKDISELKNVDEVCAELLQREAKINCLCLTAGSMSLRGREETREGLDKKMTTNYYARMRWAMKLIPLLTAASNAGELSRVLTVLAAGSEGEVYLDDLDLRRKFSLHTCLSHCVVMTDFMMEELAKRYPGTSFSHSYPGTAKMGITSNLTGPVRLAIKVIYAVASPWILNTQEAGERHLFQMTSECYPAATPGGAGIDIPQGLGIVRGTDGRTGSGGYLLDWDGRPIGDEKILEKYRAMNAGKTIYDHTMQMFEQAELRTRGLQSQQNIATSSSSNPVGWRAA